MLCVDTKKKERLGHLHRLGSCYSTDVQFVYNHDYRHLATGVLLPRGVYDCHDNVGFITLGTSRETSAFVCDAIALAWQEDRAEHYPHAQEILLTFDAGGANAVRSLRFKEDPVPLSRRLGLRLRVAHYPPYTSKWHPIEHRLFCHVERRLSGVILDSPQTALEAAQRTHTQTGSRSRHACSIPSTSWDESVLRHSSISKTNSFATTLFSGNGTTSSMPIDFRDKMCYFFLNRS